MAAKDHRMSIVHLNKPEFDWTVPVLIVGAGACGLTAALAAKDQGVDVLLLERDKTPYGSTGMSYGAICAAGSRIQKAIGINDTPDYLFEDIMAVTRGQTNPVLARLLAQEAAPTIDWLSLKHGLKLSVEKAWVGLGHRHPRLHAPHNRSGETLMSMLLTACEQAGADLLTEARVTALFVNDKSKVLGARVQRPDGSLEEVGCQAMILATCGFGANRDMVSRHIPEMQAANYHGHEGNEGDGILWGLEMNAAIADMGAYQALGSLAHPQAMVMPHTLLIGGGLQINTHGRRFENELEDISGQSLTILDQPEGICWMVYDQRLHQDALERFQEYRDAESINTARRAETIEELAAKMSVPEEALCQTLSETQHCCEIGSVDTFGRSFDLAQKLQEPFYATRVTGALFHTQGGLVVNKNAQVVTPADEPLPNLFAGGGAACSVSGPGGWGYLPAMGLCTAVTLGRVAGIAAAKLAQAESSL
jgi:fumarate reductase flavoprotein subunit